MSDETFGLDDAYGVETPDDNRELYRKWAATYDSEYIGSHGYVYHLGVVARHLSFGPSPEPVLDVGCGTGVVAEALAEHGTNAIDGVDISPEMLAVAETKGVYRGLSEMDITQPLPVDEGAYGSVISAGTFTIGHLGPEPIEELVRITAPGGRLTLGVNQVHYQAAGFADLLDRLGAAGAISDLTIEPINMYDRTDHEHGADLANVVSFVRSG